MSDPFTRLNNLTREIAAQEQERIDRALRGAWRAGYDYLHVYDALHCAGMRKDPFTIRQYVLPSNVERPPRPDTAVYRHTYDLSGVDDSVVREAIRESEGHDNE